MKTQATKTVQADKKVKIVNKNTGESCEATPPKIVRAVNCHDYLIKLLERVVSDYEGETDIGFDQTIIDIKDAIKRARGES